MGSVNCNYLPCVGSGIIVSAVHFLAGELYCEGSGKAERESPPCHIFYEFWMLPTFVTFVGTIWFDYPVRKSGIIGNWSANEAGEV